MERLKIMDGKIKICPVCKGKKIKDYGDKFKCFDCNKTYDRKIIELIKKVENLVKINKDNAAREKILGASSLNDFIIALLDVINKYEKYARNNFVLLEKIKALPKEAVLGCFCAPLACHGDIIIKIWKELHNE